LLEQPLTIRSTKVIKVKNFMSVYIVNV